jgi:hypothetical protein
VFITRLCCSCPYLSMRTGAGARRGRRDTTGRVSRKRSELPAQFSRIEWARVAPATPGLRDLAQILTFNQAVKTGNPGWLGLQCGNPELRMSRMGHDLPPFQNGRTSAPTGCRHGVCAYHAPSPGENPPAVMVAPTTATPCRRDRVIHPRQAGGIHDPWGIAHRHVVRP